MDRLWTDFVNSDYHDWRGGDRSEDRLGKASWQLDFLERWQLNAPVPASPEDELSMRNFRNELLALGARVSSGASLTDIEKQWLNGFMEAGHVRRKLNTIDQELKLQLVAVEAHWNQVMAEVAADFAMTLVEGEGGGFGSVIIRIVAGCSMMIPEAEHRSTVMIRCVAI